MSNKYRITVKKKYQKYFTIDINVFEYQTDSNTDFALYLGELQRHCLNSAIYRSLRCLVSLVEEDYIKEVNFEI